MNTRWSAVRVLISALVVFSVPLYGWEPDAADSPEAQAAALGALSTTPPPLLIQTDIRDVPEMVAGLKSAGIAYKANIEDLDQAMADLNAEVLNQEIRISLSADLLFDFDQHSLRPEAQTELERLALVVREKARGSVRIDGHTDARGSDEYNQALSERRANSVRQWLLEHADLDPGLRLETAGFGETQPAAPNQNPDGSDDPQGRALNRRVEIFIETTQ